MINQKYRIAIADDPDYNDLIAEIYYEDRILLLISQEKGAENLEVEIFSTQLNKNWILQLSDLKEAMNYAERRLLQLRKQDP